MVINVQEEAHLHDSSFHGCENISPTALLSNTETE